MLHSLLSELPRFFGPYNLLFLAQAIGVTIALTIVGCGIGPAEAWKSSMPSGTETAPLRERAFSGVRASSGRV